MKILLLLSLLVLPLLPVIAEDTAKPAAKGARELSIDETERFISEHKGMVILDVRTLDEYKEEGHLAGAKLLDFFHPEFEKAVKETGIDPSKPIIVYCAIGGRAKRAADKLTKLGFTDIILPKGSYNAWKAAGKKIEK
jgi:rhodanese-related sulfurtransferase